MEGKVNKNKSLVPILVTNRPFLICIHNDAQFIGVANFRPNLQAPRQSRIRDTYEFQYILDIFQILMQRLHDNASFLAKVIITDHFVQNESP